VISHVVEVLNGVGQARVAGDAPVVAWDANHPHPWEATGKHTDTTNHHVRDFKCLLDDATVYILFMACTKVRVFHDVTHEGYDRFFDGERLV
jgi:hypothetical protein